MAKASKTQEEIANEAIKHALKALRKRHLLEEAAHAPAVLALSKPIASQSSEWKEKAENLQVELQQCYKAQSRLSEQLVVEVAESRASKALVQEKENAVADLQKELTELRDECSQLKADLEEKIKSLELVVSENSELKAHLEEMTAKANKAESENKMLIDRWMLEKMKDAERLNEANALYEDMVQKLKASGLEQLARQQVDGIVRRSEEGAEFFLESNIPSTCKYRLRAHEGGCAAMLFEYNSGKLITGGQDRSVKMWDTNTGSLSSTLHGCLGSVLDLSITHDNRSVIAASSSNNLFVWDVSSGRVRHTLTGHTDKVCAVDVSKVSSRHVVSAAYDRTIKVWDLMKGHVDGNLRLWDIQSGKLLSEVAAHSLAVTSISLSRNGNVVVTSGRDNLHNLFDVRSLEVCGTLRASGNRVASNWSRSCISPDDNHVAAGSADGSVYIWSISKGDIVSTLKEHSSSVLCCRWSGIGKPLASADKNGIVCVWT
uniref:Protein tipD n=1 Tax=Cajanus cajan TaxID=3821 RepID=A0A151TE84_CAJCA|nr:Protein tipD [Cajanus cajan]